MEVPDGALGGELGVGPEPSCEVVNHSSHRHTSQALRDGCRPGGHVQELGKHDAQVRKRTATLWCGQAWGEGGRRKGKGEEGA